MTTKDNIAIDVAEQQCIGPSQIAAADQAQDVDGRETSPTRIRTTSTSTGTSRRKFNPVWVGLICGTAAILALGLGLGLGLSNKDGNLAGSAVDATASDLTAVDTPIMTSTETTSEMQKEPPTMVTPGIDGDDPQVGRNSDEKSSNDFMETEAETEPATSPAAPTPRFYSTAASDPIQVQLRTIDPTIMDGYAAGEEGCADLYEDIYNATLLVANQEIKRVAEYYDRYAQKWPSGGGGGGGPVFADLELEMVDASMASVVSAPSAPAAEIKAPAQAPTMADAGGEDSFGSNNQEEGVDEADIVKSDGTYVYMAYGDLLLVTDAVTGKELSRTQMPPKEKDQKDPPPLYPEPYPGPIGPILTPVDVEEISEVDGGGTDTAAATLSKEEEVMPPMRKADTDKGDRRHLRYQGKKPQASQKHRRESIWIPPNPKPRISSILHDAESNRLAVIVSGYGDGYRYNYFDGPILRDQNDVHVRLYDTSTIPIDGKPLSLITSRKMGGGYRSARMIGSTAHIAVQSGVDWHRHITRYLDRWQVVYDGMNKTEYMETAAEQAKIAADKFATRLVRELKELVDNDDEAADDCSGVTKIALFTSFEGDGEDDEDALPSSLSSGGALNSYLRVSSFDMNMQLDAADAESSTPPMMTVKTAGSFFPTSHSDIYASKDFIVASGRGYIRRSSRSWDDSTYLLTFGLSSDGSAPTGRAIGRVPGYLLNQFSVDEYNGYLRVATTSQAQWGCLDQPIVEPKEDGDILIERPCKWGELRPSSSQVTVLKIPGEKETSRKLEVVGVADGLGKTEVIFSCRFFNDKAYVVTFRRTDPLYALDLSDPENPIVTDELKITGFSSYLHPIGDDRLLAIGREADEETGRVTGFQITLFDVSDLNNTAVLKRYTLEEQWSSSSAENDHMAFRYLPQSNLLLIPLSIRGIYDQRDPFDGFTVYYVNPSGKEKIEPRFSVSMVEDPSFIRYGCWYDAYMPARTLVFRGNATFIKGHSSVSYTLGDTPTQRWYHNFDDGRDKTSGCFSYWR